MADSISVKVQGSGAVPYDVKLFADGRVYCSCPAWKFQRINPAHRVCKHTSRAKAAAAVILQDNAAMAVA